MTNTDTLTSFNDGRKITTVIGDPGDLLALPEGATVCCSGTEGTYLLLSITPVNWRDLV